MYKIIIIFTWNSIWLKIKETILACAFILGTFYSNAQNQHKIELDKYEAELSKNEDSTVSIKLGLNEKLSNARPDARLKYEDMIRGQRKKLLQYIDLYNKYEDEKKRNLKEFQESQLSRLRAKGL